MFLCNIENLGQFARNISITVGHSCIAEQGRKPTVETTLEKQLTGISMKLPEFFGDIKKCEDIKKIESFSY